MKATTIEKHVQERRFILDDDDMKRAILLYVQLAVGNDAVPSGNVSIYITPDSGFKAIVKARTTREIDRQGQTVRTLPNQAFNCGGAGCDAVAIGTTFRTAARRAGWYVKHAQQRIFCPDHNPDAEGESG